MKIVVSQKTCFCIYFGNSKRDNFLQGEKNMRDKISYKYICFAEKLYISFFDAAVQFYVHDTQYQNRIDRFTVDKV